MKSAGTHHVLNKRKWNLLSGVYDTFFYDVFRFMQRKAIEKLEIKPEMRILDLGCGTGRGLILFAEKHGADHELFGVDISEKMISKALKNCANIKNAQFFVAPAEKLPFGDSYFDAILCTNSFHHYSDPDHALQEAGRVVKTGGKTYFLELTPDSFPLKAVNFLLGKIERQHTSFYSTAEMKILFERNGFEHLKSEKIIYPFKIHIGVKK